MDDRYYIYDVYAMRMHELRVADAPSRPSSADPVKDPEPRMERQLATAQMAPARERAVLGLAGAPGQALETSTPMVPQARRRSIGGGYQRS